MKNQKKNKICPNYKLVGKNLTKKFDLEPFKVKTILSDLKIIQRIFKNKNIILQNKEFCKTQETKEKCFKQNPSLSEPLNIFLQRIEEFEKVFGELFLKKFPLDFLIEEQFKDLQKSNIQSFTTPRKNKTQKRNKKNQYKSYRLRNFSFFSFLYALKDTLYHCFEDFQKIKPIKNLAGKQTIEKKIYKYNDCLNTLSAGLHFCKIKISEDFDLAKKSNKKDKKKNTCKNKNSIFDNNKSNSMSTEPKTQDIVSGLDPFNNDGWEVIQKNIHCWDKKKKKKKTGKRIQGVLKKNKNDQKDKKYQSNNNKLVIDQKNYKNYYVSLKKVCDEHPDFLEKLKPSSTMLIYEWCDEMKSVKKMLNATYCAANSVKSSNSFLGKWGKLGFNFLKYNIMTKSAGEKIVDVKCFPHKSLVQESIGLSDRNRFLRWYAFRPYPKVIMEKVKYISKIDPSCRITTKKEKYGENSLELRIISDQKKEFETKNIVVFIHGGAFVAGKSMTHAPYLRRWAKEAKCTVIAIEYTLSPKKRIDDQIIECFEAWRWISYNFPKKTLILAGDSAGGCLSCGLTMKSILQKNFRKPDALVLGYPALNIKPIFGLTKILFSNEPLFSLTMLLKIISWSRPVQVEKQEDHKFGKVSCKQFRNSYLNIDTLKEQNSKKKNHQNGNLHPFCNKNKNTKRNQMNKHMMSKTFYQFSNVTSGCSKKTRVIDEKVPLSKKHSEPQLSNLSQLRSDSKNKLNLKSSSSYHSKSYSTKINIKDSHSVSSSFKIENGNLTSKTNSSDSYDFKLNDKNNKLYESVFKNETKNINWGKYDENKKNPKKHNNNLWVHESIWSPLWMKDQILKEFPETLLLSGLFDPFLEGNSLFADRMWGIEKSDFHFKLYALPHAFWTFSSKFKFNTDSMKETINFLNYFFNKKK
ncbi:triacylglycerol lipase [Anaeramoeba flamelloides]|uniref:Triacylglycerol lipase n=1 Tax=Anaeramoeba flamelloides TaxID=1746091 RepID=A0AAV7YUH2_9EUKA|nr:triacylglycerol lipase [Anaeramoeba flamelloides]